MALSRLARAPFPWVYNAATQHVLQPSPMTRPEMHADTQQPYFTANLPGIGGTLKQEPDDFVVEEIPAYIIGGQQFLSFRLPRPSP